MGLENTSLATVLKHRKQSYLQHFYYFMRLKIRLNQRVLELYIYYKVVATIRGSREPHVVILLPTEAAAVNRLHFPANISLPHVLDRLLFYHQIFKHLLSVGAGADLPNVTNITPP